MANEATIVGAMSFTKSGVSSSLLKQVFETMTGSDFVHGYQTIGTSEEAIAIGDVTAGGWIMIINKDATNYIKVHKTGDVANYIIRLNAGEFALFRAAVAPYATADTSACEIEYLVIDD